jgi:hypothetical protein
MAAAVRTVAIRRRAPAVTDPRTLVVALLITAATALPGLTAGAADRPAVPIDAPSIELYIDRDSGARLTQLDPETLADFAAGPAIETCASPYSCAISADGSTVVTTDGGWSADDESSPRSTVVVRDGLTGPERARFDLPGHLEMPRLSDDGSRLVVQRLDAVAEDVSPLPLPSWQVYRTAGGKLLATVEADGRAGWRESRIDSAASRLYHFAVAPVLGGSTPWPVELIAHDLSTGAEIGRLWLPDVLTGSWQTERVIDGDPLRAMLAPGLAISPDGRQIALVHADRDAVTLIDTETFEVERTVELARPTGLTDRLLGLLSLAPRTALAKEPAEGSTAWGTYAVDGRFLYVWGMRTGILDDGRAESYSTGLRLVDLSTGAVQAEGMPGVHIHSLNATPDGRSLYVLGWDKLRSENGFADVFPLVRLDAATLQAQAMRPFTAANLPGWVILQPVLRQ